LKPNTHTNIARIIVNGLIVAKLAKKALEFEAKILDSNAINKNTSTFTLVMTKP
jgi:hypothetical protein